MRGSLVFAVAIFGCVSASAGLERAFQYRCSGLEGYDIRATYNVDSGWGNIRAPRNQFVIGFTLGPMVGELVPAERPPGFRSFNVERIGQATLRYGLNVLEKQVQGTLTGAPLNRRINLVALPKDANRFLSVARALADARCH